MATPRTSTFTVATGGSVWAGISSPAGLPPWVPAPGESAKIQLNDINSDASYQANLWYTQARGVAQYFVNWSGGAFNPDASANGALMMWGGGHGGGLNLKALVFDFTSRQFSAAGPENPASDYTGGPPDLPGLDASWSDYNTGADYIVPGLHSYNFLTYAPANVSGVGSKGALVLSLIVPSAVNAAPHFIDLATNRMSRASSNVGVSGTGYGAGGVYDSLRQRYWWTTSGQTTINLLDWTESHPRTVHTYSLSTAWGLDSYYALFRYIPEADVALGLWCEYGSNAVKGEVWDMSTSPPTRMAQLTLPSYPNGNAGAGDILGSGFGWDWCPITGAAYLYMGYASTTVWKLTPSSLALASATWTWSTETFTGAVYSNPWPTNFGEQPLGRWCYVPALRCFCWAWPIGTHTTTSGGTTTGVMQLWRPLGT